MRVRNQPVNMRQQLSRIAYAVSVGCKLNRLARRLNRHKLVILTYHRLYESEADVLENFDGQYVHVEHFAQQMRYLARHYHVLPLDECLAPHPGDLYRAAVTFDDGYASVYRYAYPVLRELRLPATVFVPTDFVQTRRPMWWDRLRLAVRKTTQQMVTVTCNDQQWALPLRTLHEKEAALRELATVLERVPEVVREELFTTLCPPQQLAEAATIPRNAPLDRAQIREMSAYGITFAGHGKSHKSFLTLSSEELWQEMRESKVVLEEWTGKKVTYLAYPYGDFDWRALELLPRAGYQGAVTTIDGLSHDENCFTLRRIAVGGPTTFPQFVAAVSGLRDVVGRVIRKQDRRLLP